MKHQFISIEGIEGAGKSTVQLLIRDYFTHLDHHVIITREPGGSEIAEEIRKLILYPQAFEPMLAETELLLMFAARTQHLHQCIIPGLQSGKWVISDRFVDASYAYQGGGRGLPYSSIHTLDKMIVGDYYPSLTILLDISVLEGMNRAKTRAQRTDRIEQEEVTFFERVRQVYLDRALEDPKRIKIIDAHQDLASVKVQLQEILDTFLST